MDMAVRAFMEANAVVVRASVTARLIAVSLLVVGCGCCLDWRMVRYPRIFRTFY